MRRLNARILAVGGVVVGQLGVLTAVLDGRLASHSLGWVVAVELPCFLAAAVLGGTAPRAQRSAGSDRVPVETEEVLSVRVPQTVAG